MNDPSAPSRPHLLARRIASTLFWGWNVLFVCATLPLLPAVPAIVSAGVLDDVPLDYALVLLGWMVLPWASMALAATRLRRRPEAVAFLFFALEGPFYCLCLARLAVLRELTPGVAHGLLVLAAGVAVLGTHVLLRPLPTTRGWQGLRLAATTCLALVGVWVAAVVVVLGAPFVLRGLWELASPRTWGLVPQLLQVHVLMLLLVPLTALVLLAVASLLVMPLGMAAIFLGAFRQAWRDVPLTPRARAGVVAAMLLLQAALLVFANAQPQVDALARLRAGTLTPETFARDQAQLRAGLLNAYLAPYRYASGTGQANLVADAYRRLLNWDPGPAAWMQGAFNALTRPLLYDGTSVESDASQAAELYERYFDTPIQRGERHAIARALSATYNADEREAGLLNIDQRKVWVAEQHARVEPQGDLARVTLEETYVNLTTEQQEVFYLFSLPETATITGLWLGNDRAAMERHVIAPRGAAQRVYREEVRRRIDPALLEQVGPRQYRLRAFPVLPRPAKGSATPAPRLYLRLEYVTFAHDGGWPLPLLAERRNAGWTRHTVRTCDGGSCPGDLATWWPRQLPMRTPVTPARHAYVDPASGSTVIAQPAPGAAPAVRGRRILLVVDRSGSMAKLRPELLQALRAARETLAGNEVEVLLATTPVMRQPPRLLRLSTLDDAMVSGFMGGSPANALLEQAAASGPHDLILVLTDAGAFDLKTTPLARPSAGMLALVHLGGALAPVYDDATLEAVQASGGGSFTSLPEAWDHFARAQSAAPGFLLHRNGYQFLLQSAAPATAAPDSLFARIAGRLLVASKTRQAATPLGAATLAEVHALAVRHDVVTPYSSMLVLVEERQRQALAAAETQPDGFERAQESGTEALQKPTNPFTASMTPEPEEWLLLAVAAGIALWMAANRRRTGRPSSFAS